MAKKQYFIFHILENFIERISKAYTSKLQAKKEFTMFCKELFPEMTKKEIKQATQNGTAFDDYDTLSLIEIKK